MTLSSHRGRIILQWLLTLVGIVAAVLYFIWRSPPDLFREGFRVSPWWLITGFLFYGVFLLFSTIRWGVLLSATPRLLPWRDLAIVTMIAKGLGSITPMNAGEFLKAELSHRILGEQRGSQYGIVAVERVVDVATLLLFSTIGILTQAKLRTYLADRLLLVLGVVIGVIACGIVGLVLAVRWSPKLRSLFEGMRSASHLLLERKSVLALTLILWISIAVMWWALAAAFNAPVTLFDAMLLMSVTTFVIVGSFIPGGIGIADIGAAEIGVMLGYSPAQAMLFPLAIRANTLISLVYGAIGWILRQWSTTLKKT